MEMLVKTLKSPDNGSLCILFHACSNIVYSNWSPPFFLWFIRTNRQLRSKDISKFHIQLCLSLGGMLIVFVTGFDKTGNRAGCITVGVLIHYFTLVAWMWMGAEALLMFKKVVLVFGETSFCFVLSVSLICWGKCNMHKHRFTYT